MKLRNKPNQADLAVLSIVKDKSISGGALAMSLGSRSALRNVWHLKRMGYIKVSDGQLVAVTSSKRKNRRKVMSP